MVQRLLQLILVVGLLAGCAPAQPPLGQWVGLSTPPRAEVATWAYGQDTGFTLRTRHYAIHTTITDDDVRRRLPAVLEGAYERFGEVAPGIKPTTRPMESFIFAHRGQWAEFTRKTMGQDAAVYLRINRGGYTAGDRFVSFYYGETGTYSVAAHEGWHQFAARHFVGRLPPFLEEGIACLFEHMRWRDDQPFWNLSMNPMRAHALRDSIEQRKLWPLDQLIAMHAGQVVGLPADRIEAFYAQAWAFARFLREADHARYRPAFERLLRDIATGEVHDPSRSHRRAGLPWIPASVKPMLEHYLDMPLADIDQRFSEWMRYIAYREFNAHWGTQ